MRSEPRVLIVGCRHEHRRLVGGPQPPGGLAHLAVEREQLGQLRGLVARVGDLHVLARELGVGLGRRAVGPLLDEACLE